MDLLRAELVLRNPLMSWNGVGASRGLGSEGSFGGMSGFESDTSSPDYGADYGASTSISSPSAPGPGLGGSSGSDWGGIGDTEIGMSIYEEPEVENMTLGEPGAYEEAAGGGLLGDIKKEFSIYDIVGPLATLVTRNPEFGKALGLAADVAEGVSKDNISALDFAAPVIGLFNPALGLLAGLGIKAYKHFTAGEEKDTAGIDDSAGMTFGIPGTYSPDPGTIADTTNISGENMSSFWDDVGSLFSGAGKAVIEYAPDIIETVGGYLGAQEQKDAIKQAQEQLQQQTSGAISTQQQTLDRIIGLQEPFREAGVTALGPLSYLTGTGLPGQPSPMYTYQQELGEKAINRAAAARHDFGSTPTVQALSDFNRSLGAEESERQLARLMNLVNIGRGATTETGSAVQSTGANVSNIMTSQIPGMTALAQTLGRNRGSTYADIGSIAGNILEDMY